MRILLILFCLLSLCWSPSTAQTMYPVRNIDELNELLEKAANQMQDVLYIRLEKKLSGKPLNKVLADSLCFNHIRGYTYGKNGKNDYRLQLKYMDSTRMLAAFRNPGLESQLSSEETRALSVARNRVKTVVHKGMSDLEAVKALHDDLVNRVCYDKKSGPDCTTMFLTNKGVCDAYARCMYLMLNMLKIPCHIMVGHGRGEAHAWNLVELEQGEWFHIDATWNDPCVEKGPQQLRHTYFCLSDAEIARDHKWNRKQFPVTPEVEAYYFKKAGLYFKSYEPFWKSAQKAYEKGDTSYCAYLTCFGNNKKFGNSFKTYSENGGRIALVGWAPPGKKRKGPVSLCFNNKGGYIPTHDMPEPDSDDMLPTEKNPSWLDGNIWKDISESIDMDAVVKQGSRMLLKGINEAENMAEDFEKAEGGLQEKGKAVLDGFLKRVSE